MISFYDLYQSGQISEAQSDAAQAKDEVSRYRERIKDLEFSQQRMALASQAMWEMVCERLGGFRSGVDRQNKRDRPA